MYKVGDKVIYKGVPKDFKRLDHKAIILRKTFEPNYFVIKLLSGAELLVSSDFLSLDLNWFKLIFRSNITWNITKSFITD